MDDALAACNDVLSPYADSTVVVLLTDGLSNVGGTGESEATTIKPLVVELSQWELEALIAPYFR